MEKWQPVKYKRSNEVCCKGRKKRNETNKMRKEEKRRILKMEDSTKIPHYNILKPYAS